MGEDFLLKGGRLILIQSGLSGMLSYYLPLQFLVVMDAPSKMASVECYVIEGFTVGRDDGFISHS